MADLKTNYVDDVLDTTKNQLRKYQQIQNDDGTVSFVDVTEYTQVGTSFGAKDINDTNAAINDVNGKLNQIIVTEDITYSNVSISSSNTYVAYDTPSKTGFKLIGAFLTGWTGGSNMSASGTLNVCYDKPSNSIMIKSIADATFKDVIVTCLYVKEF